MTENNEEILKQISKMKLENPPNLIGLWFIGCVVSVIFGIIWIWFVPILWFFMGLMIFDQLQAHFESQTSKFNNLVDYILQIQK